MVGLVGGEEHDVSKPHSMHFAVSVHELAGEGGTNAELPSPLPFPLCGKVMGG